LQQGGSDIDAELELRYDMVIRVATGRMEVEQIKDWLIEHSKPI